jgi:transposase
MKNQDEIPTTNPSEVEALIKRIEVSQLSESDKQLVGRLLRLVLMLLRMVESKNTSISRLKKMLFGPRTDKTAQQPSKQSDTAVQSEANAQDPSEEQQQSKAEPTNITERKVRKGHGRLAAAKYTGANKVVCRDDNLEAGGQCPHPECVGRLYDTKESQEFIRFTARPPIDATLYQQQVLRCRLCEARFAAALPAGVAAIKYDETADVMMVLLKYGAGLPFYRLAGLQALMGVPLPASTQFMRCEAVADIVYPVYLELARLAALGEVVCGDDTRVKILTYLKENKTLPKGARVGMQTTGIGALIGERVIALYYSGRRHTGENLYQLLEQRPAHLDIVRVMADGAAKNWTPQFQSIVCKCLQHARKYFKDARPAFHYQCQHVLDKLAEVYQNDAATKAMTADARLAYHQEKSLPVMDELKEWMEQQLATHTVEENDACGKAIKYFLDHYEGLTQFCRVSSAPLDNNLAERILKRAVLNRKNSYFYKTEHGAAVGDISMSLIASCALAQIDVFDYLVTLLRNARAVRAAPAEWLPWNYTAHKTLVA